jgi:glycosyltransferase involved in cell wall biosynthesis
MNVHQILPNISPGDAIGNEALLIQKVLREKGYRSEIFCEAYHPAVKAKVYQKYVPNSGKDTILIYHHSIGSPIAEFIAGLPDKKIMLYHNITTPSYFEGIDDHLAYLLQKGRSELPMLAPYITMALGDSEYNRLELEEAGYTRTGVFPVLTDFSRYPDPSPKILEQYTDNRTNILFVGRISPNKRFEDIVRAFSYYKRIDPSARLLLPGSYDRMERYHDSLLALVAELGVPDVIFPGKVGFDELVAYYQVADLFLCMSEHEGFNVPVVECMYFNVPIIAYNACAIPYTLGDAGVLINIKNFEEVAEMMSIIIRNKTLRERIIQKQSERLSDFDYRLHLERLLAIIDEVGAM